jgi:hypothetical protein
MANKVPRRVVFKKPKIKMPINTYEKKRLDTSHVPEVPEPEPEEEIEIPEEEQEPQPVVQPPTISTTSGKKILMREEVKQKPEVKKLEIKRPEIPEVKRKLTFDEKFLDNMHTKSTIAKDEKTLDKLKEQKLPPQQKQKKVKRKKRITKYSILSFLLFIVTAGWIYKVIRDYMNNKLDGSLASFIYIIALALFALIMLAWFIIEIVVEDKDEKQ